MPGCDDDTRPDISLCTRDIGINVEYQQNAHYQDTSFIIEVKSHRRLFGEAVRQMGTYMLHMFRNQLDRRDAIGVTLCGTIAKVVVFGHDAVWASTEADLNTGPGRRTLIAQIVDWSLCSTDRLGLDSTIHRGPLLPPAQPAAAGRPPPQPRRVYEIVIDGVSYFSEACRQVVDKLTGQRWRCIPVSENANAVGGPSHLLIDYWPLANHDEAVAISHVNARLRNIVGIRGSYPQVAKSVRVRQQRERGQAVDDDTETAYGALSRIPRNMAAGGRPVLDTHLRRHKRVLINYPGHAISECENEHSAIIAISRAMTTHNALFVVMQILHGDINDNNIVHRMEAGETLGMLMGYDYAIDPTTGNQRQDQPETAVIQALQSIRSLEDPGAVRTPLDDWESLLYLVCWLGTFGVNQAQRAAYIAGLPADPKLPIKTWNQGTATDIADQKRLHMTTERTFRSNILLKMRNGPLRLLALDIYRALFLHPGCYGVTKVTNDELAEIGDGDIRDALHAVPVVDDERDPLVLRHAFVDTIVANLLEVLARHRDVALVALNAAAANIAGGAEEGAGV
ncbi:hypothetical protein GGH93_002666 [Coemansia aciculifera]|nr:hypothetical protein GGH93_002666 [Coemansia aciculifera]